MALKGQGDPRWIVAARDDGKNVNNWHWTEADYTSWAKGRLQELLQDIVIDTPKISVKTKECTVNGEVSVNTRKGKTILFYELDVSLKWEGEWKDTVDERKGTIQMPYISEENDDDDFEVKFTVEKDDDIGYKMKEDLKKQIVPILKERVPIMLKELRDNTVSKTNLKLKDAPSAKVLDKVEIPAQTATPIAKQPAPTQSHAVPVVKGTSISMKEKFLCSQEDLFSTLLDSNRVKAYAGADADISPEKGKKFKLFSGYVSGENVEVDRPNKIVQKWRFNTWPEGHFSTVTITFEQKNGKTILNLLHTGVPEDDKEHTEGGWKDNYWRRIKGIFGYGNML
jgi:activator of HSP90 ATPase